VNVPPIESGGSHVADRDQGSRVHREGLEQWPQGRRRRSLRATAHHHDALVLRTRHLGLQEHRAPE